ncbi:hypothetical protein [Gluconobacter wancherniae]|uniref:hypothetical protein n=1 Tax=Gluconobacter wancherniae TaxID=1307955 RepID=UPI002013980B|nr:hypothetical protein [Gluconobacter wancherniae]
MKNSELCRPVVSMVAVERIRTLQTYGIKEFHVFTLNRFDLTYATARILGMHLMQTNASHNLTGILERTTIPSERETTTDFDTTEGT